MAKRKPGDHRFFLKLVCAKVKGRWTSGNGRPVGPAYGIPCNPTFSLNASIKASIGSASPCMQSQ